MKSTTSRLLLSSGILLCSAGASAAVLSSRLVSIALDRQAPLCVRTAKLRLSGSPNHKALLKHLDQAADALAQVNCKTVEISARDGIHLTGHWYPCSSPKRVILAMHGWRSSWAKDFGAVADYWHNHHCSVLFVEQRGQNASGGSYMGFGLLERYDCLDWIRFLSPYANGLPIYLCGVSMGAATVLMAAGLSLPPSVHGIIADCGFTSLHAIWKHVARHNLHIPYQLCSFMADLLCRKKLHMSPRSYSTLDAMKRCRTPVLFIHGTDDHFVPVQMTFDNYKACKAPKHLFIVPGAEHGMSYFTDPAGYQTAVEQFWHLYDESRT